MPPEDAHANPDAFAWIRLINFRSHVDTRIPLAPGLTCLVGGNDIGKSAVLGAFGALVDGDIKESDIRHGARAATIEIGLADGRVATVTRSARKNVKVHWELRLASGGVLTSDGSDVPRFLADTFKMGSIGDFSLHISQQTRPNFLLEDTSDMAFCRAEVLSVGREAVHLDRLMEAWKRLLATSGTPSPMGSARTPCSPLDCRLGRGRRPVPGGGPRGHRHPGDPRRGRALDALYQTIDRNAQAAARRAHLEDRLAVLIPLRESPVLEEAAAVLEMRGTVLEAQARTAQAHSRHEALAALAPPPGVVTTEGMCGCRKTWPPCPAVWLFSLPRPGLSLAWLSRLASTGPRACRRSSPPWKPPHRPSRFWNGGMPLSAAWAGRPASTQPMGCRKPLPCWKLRRGRSPRYCAGQARWLPWSLLQPSNRPPMCLLQSRRWMTSGGGMTS